MDGDAWVTEALPASKDWTQWMFCLPLQVDGRNGVDLVAGAKNDRAAIGWFEAPETPRDLSAWRWHAMRGAGWIMSLIPTDLDGDGQTDVAYTDRRNNLRGAGWLRNPGPGDLAALRAPWTDHAFGGGEQEVMFLDHGAIDAGGPEEWICATRGEGLQRFTPGKEEDAWRQTEIPMPEETGTGKSVAIGDLNGDGRPDLAVTCENAKGLHGVFWLEHTDTAWVPHAISGLTGTKYDLAVLLDQDDDGDLDLLTCEERENLGVIWYENPAR